MFGIGGPELAVILVVALIFVGPEKLPKVARSVGAGLRDLRRAANLAQSELKETVDDLIREADLEDEAYDRERAARKAKATADGKKQPRATVTSNDSGAPSDQRAQATPAGRAPDPAAVPENANATADAAQVPASAPADAAVEANSERDGPRDFADLFVQRANAWQDEQGSQNDEPSADDGAVSANAPAAPFEMDLPGVRLDEPPVGVAGTQARRSTPRRAGSAAARADAAQLTTTEAAHAATEPDEGDKDGQA